MPTVNYKPDPVIKKAMSRFCGNTYNSRDQRDYMKAQVVMLNARIPTMDPQTRARAENTLSTIERDYGIPRGLKIVS